MSDSVTLNLLPRNPNFSNNDIRVVNPEETRSSAGAPLALHEDDAILPPERPSAGPEIDDLYPGNKPSDGSEIDKLLPPQSYPKPSDYPGVDDGLIPRREDGVPAPPRPSFPTPEDPIIPTVPGSGKKLPDVNVYQQKKTLAQGMMDLALLTANANQLRYVLDAGSVHTYYYVNLIFILTSIALQVAVGLLLLWNSRFNINKEHHIIVANRINNFTVTGIFLITILNVFISAFGLPDRSLMMMAPQILNNEVESITDTGNVDVSTVQN
uniref:Uncharacterized protein n=2 Tax=Homalodisca liturata TaxID=320908 RepID=A0A1B6H7N2_9HEMI